VHSERSDLENLFVDCVELIRKDVTKRRLRNEITAKSKTVPRQGLSKDDEKEFEESLVKLAQLSKKRIKIEQFTDRDKINILDLFVNNEETLLHIYEQLFP